MFSKDSSSRVYLFRKRKDLINIFRGVPILGLTATATSNVLDDVKDMLGIQAALTFRAGFNRSNLKYKVVQKPGSEDECTEEIAKTIKRDFAGQTGIIYCLSRNDCEKVAKALKSHGIKAKHYHAYMEPVDRSGAHQGWISGKIQVIVATVAFGMGIDKPNVRFVIHHSLPKSIENYYQASARILLRMTKQKNKSDTGMCRFTQLLCTPEALFRRWEYTN